ncbi:NUDIX hydrolase [Paenibacillus sp. CGMCC 1.16610]|uniref:NUDIX domain-containing protein n=1 Tax=Paenibacillus anseongense TaxID=2682845 RepID=A0ABW9U6E1_9BACL|nr:MULTISPECIES: NUDIX hydrolase [Paenibacillus]MBA2939062.1 NUDIX hydrolase [Paenibacillus sp. CGMCC 1.16610]MVQ35021.1 NUDIX domain-containing protein [Paenibacillus anseongense]
MYPPSHRLATGVIIRNGDAILLVKGNNNRWSLPKGGIHEREVFSEAAIREAKEETGFNVKLNDVAFVTEFKRSDWGQYLQVYYSADIIDGNITVNNDPDNEISEASFVPIKELEAYLNFRPQVLPLKDWIKNKVTQYHFFDLDVESIEVININ